MIGAVSLPLPAGSDLKGRSAVSLRSTLSDCRVVYGLELTSQPLVLGNELQKLRIERRVFVEVGVVTALLEYS